MNTEIERLLEEAEEKLGQLKSIQKMAIEVKKNDTAYEMRANTILEDMSESLQRIRKMVEDLNKKD